jgi:hypothetical protein
MTVRQSLRHYWNRDPVQFAVAATACTCMVLILVAVAIAAGTTHSIKVQ